MWIAGWLTAPSMPGICCLDPSPEHRSYPWPATLCPARRPTTRNARKPARSGDWHESCLTINRSTRCNRPPEGQACWPTASSAGDGRPAAATLEYRPFGYLTRLPTRGAPRRSRVCRYRPLAVIVAADVAGHARLAGAEKDSTLASRRRPMRPSGRDIAPRRVRSD